ncbi:CHAT domain-containing protein [Collybia nuda]|uniref:CHAT domain-containing protein n=1 Tax=Collybia nuda TaxID=64659 RepID=A0A9P5Y6U3_9AGAR|nr:CHAT domain-containing protein [Collybia nuda]
MQTHHSDIEQLEMKFRKASLTGDQLTTDLFFDLGWAYQQSYTEFPHIDALENAVKYYRNGLTHDPVDEDCRGSLLINLGNVLIIKHEQLGNLDDLVEAISCHEQGLVLHVPGHPNRTMSLNGLANALNARFCQLGNMRDLENVIIYREQGLELCPPGHLNRPIFLNNLANALETRFLQLGDVADLEKALSWHTEGLELRPPGQPNRSSSLMNLANALQSRFQQLGSLENLDKAIALYQQAMELCPPGDIGRASSAINLGNALSARFQQLGNIVDLDEAIKFHIQALELHPLGHTDRHASLMHLGNAWKIRFEQLGEIKDLERAMALHKEGLELCPPGHPTRYKVLVNLANTFLTRFDQIGEIYDLEEAITCYQQALSLCPIGHSSRPMLLMNLGNGLNAKFEQLGEVAYLTKAICYLGEALELCPSSHSDRLKILNNLANTLEARFWQLGKIEDLDQVIVHYQQVVSMFLAQSHPQKPSSLHNLATAFKTRGEHLGKMKDLEEAIAYHKQALELFPHNHPNRFMPFMGLGNAFASIFKYRRNLEDLEQATESYQSTLVHLPQHHPFHSSVFAAQASLIISLHDLPLVECTNCSHIDEACRLFKLAAHYTTSSLYNRFLAAKKWSWTAHKYQHISDISAYTIALELQQQHLSLIPSIISQQKLMESSTTLSLNAAACAINNCKPDVAVQFLEQGRSILWSKIQGYRQTFEELSKRDPEFAREIRATAHQLEHDAIQSPTTDIDLQHRVTLSVKWNSLLEKIRELEEYSGYLQAVPFDTLKIAAIKGPVILINISDVQSDAIILIKDVPPVVIALKGVSPWELELLVKRLSKVTTGVRPSTDVALILQHLWQYIVQPVVIQLALLKVPEKAHIWWCPTSYLCGLPLHAAGPYKKGCKNLPDMSGSIRPQSSLGMLLVSQPDSTIPQVLAETKIIKSFGKNINICSGQDATKDAVLKSLQSHSWVHFACHGHQEEQPFNSWFQLYNGEHLTVLDLAKAQIPDAEFAFLSACHSAAGSIYGTPDESIHLAAALQFCGFRSVIGTLWAMVDDNGPTITEVFYRNIFSESSHADLENAAEALNSATRELRKQHVPLDQWINFVHIGA